MSSRREARERAMQAVYAFTVGGDEAEHVISTVIDSQLGTDKEAKAFAAKLFLKTVDISDEADAIVVRYTENWELSRIALIDRILLRIAICEMLHFPDIPAKATINEAIEVAKRYSTPKSGQFINGILDAILLDFQKEGRLKKAGRGLVGMESIAKRSEQTEE
ncbi:MAG: transcription antitermination factor NusB [Bacteroidetes bacterium]|nr:transcription antitermination factor NusB [Bacteroidota bacterium]